MQRKTTMNKSTFRFTEEQTKFLINNYSKIGAEECSKKLNILVKRIKTKVFKLKLILNKEVRSRLSAESRKPKDYNDYNINPNQFLNISSPEVAYILGLLWADGYIKNDKKRSRIEISGIEEDLKEIKWIFDKIGKWNYYNLFRKNRKKQLLIQTNNRPIATFLEKNDYQAKSGKSADKILALIPNNLKHYWFRGLIDGDGCFYFNSKQYLTQFSVAGPYNQDWTYLELLCQQLNIKYVIKRKKQLQQKRINKSSILRITNRRDIIKFANFIYYNYPKDKMGLSRKYNKFLLIKQVSDGQRF